MFMFKNKPAKLHALWFPGVYEHLGMHERALADYMAQPESDARVVEKWQAAVAAHNELITTFRQVRDEEAK